MESCSNQKSVKQIKIYFILFKVATLCLDDSFAHLAFTLLSNSSQTISIGLRSGNCGGQVI